MSTICNAPVAAQRTAREAATMKRWWMAYTTWRTQQAAIARLWSIHWEPKDIGLTRSNITDDVRNQALRGRAAEPQRLMSKQGSLAILANIVRYWHKADMS